MGRGCGSKRNDNCAGLPFCGIIMSTQPSVETVHFYFQEDDMVPVPKVGRVAPDFALKSHDGRMICLSDYRGKKNVVIAFFPLAWTPV
jgi:peroxiredoxin